MGILFPKVADQSRVLLLNTFQKELRGNKIDTAKYSIATFLPKSLLLQFTRLSNVIFLANAVLQSIPIISTISPITAIGPLAFVLSLSMMREGYQDYKRHKKDWQINSRKTQVLKKGEFWWVEWDEVRPGDFLKIKNGEIVPADTLLITTTSESGICYVETANLDGENNLKEKRTIPELAHLTPASFQALNGALTADKPNPHLYEFAGRVDLEDRAPIFMQFSNLLLRQTVVKNTEEVIGLALYCGHDSKILQNQGKIHHKMSSIQEQINLIQVALIILLVLLCAISSMGYSMIHQRNQLRAWNSYIPATGFSLPIQSVLIFFTIFLLLNFLIPITLNILIEGIKTFSAVFLSLDKKLYDRGLKRHCGVLNSSIVEQLGLIDCVLTDKTGTLTANQMVFRAVAMEDRVFSSEAIQDQLQLLKKDESFCELMLAMALCHEVVRDARREQYQGSSPDEVCFVNYAHLLGFRFCGRARKWANLQIWGQHRRIQLIQVLPFSSRKRMSVVVRDPSRKNKVILYTKGADSAIFERSHWYSDSQKFNRNIDTFAKDGLRTLVFAKRVLSAKEIRHYLTQKQRIRYELRQRMISKQQAQEQQSALVDYLQANLDIIGATGIEDRLQDDVPVTLSRLQQANIRVMMVTGDKLETAQNIGYLSHLIRQNYKVYRLSVDIQQPLKYCEELSNQTIDGLPFTLIIQGKQIAQILSHESLFFATLLARAKSVIFCRSSPKQKAVIVRFVKEKLGLVVLAIGDGGNDVGMIEEANVGVGLIGKEGNSAAAVSDFSIGQFRFLDRLVLHHGRWFYFRLSYFFVFFGLKNMAITVVIFLYLMDSAFSGTLVFTQLFYLLYNCFVGISMLVNSALFDQDINDDLHPALFPYLPKIYSETKRRELFSYWRYVVWSIAAIVLAGIIYYIIRFSLLGAWAIDEEGRSSDIKTTQICNGISLNLVILVLNYIDTESHTSFFTNFVLSFASLLPTVSYFIAQNYMTFLNMYLAYSDNFSLRFYLTIFAVVCGVWLSKAIWQCFRMETQPSIIDMYKKALSLDQLRAEQIFQRMMRRSGQKYEQQVQNKRNYCSNVHNITTEPIQHKLYRSAVINIHETEQELKYYVS